MSLRALPNELLHRIFRATTQSPRWIASEGTHSWQSRKNHVEVIKLLRLTCKQFEDICTDLLFETVSLHAEQNAFQAHHGGSRTTRIRGAFSQADVREESDPRSSVSKFMEVVNHGELGRKVRSVVLRTTVDDEEASEGSDRMTEAWRDAVKSIDRFPHLSSVHIRFREQCHAEDERYYAWVTEDEEFRTDVLLTTFKALSSQTSRANHLKTLSITNLQNINNDDLVNSSKFKNVLSRISELNLLIVVEIEDACPEGYTQLKALYDFHSAGLYNAWLQPTCENLTQLTLFTNTYWGWLPSFDLRGVLFPNIKYLALGNFTFAHDWHIDWLTSHFGELETLIMVDCPILFHIYEGGSLYEYSSKVNREDHVKLALPPVQDQSTTGNEPEENEDHDNDDHNNHMLYGSRWYNFFPKFEAKMLHLTKFVYAHEGWPNIFNMEQAFAERDLLVSSLGPKRYVAFNGGIGPSPWVEGDDLSKDGDADEGWYSNDGVKVMNPATSEETFRFSNADDDDDDDVPSRRDTTASEEVCETDCQKRDREAFHSLLSTVAWRAREKGVV